MSGSISPLYMYTPCHIIISWIIIYTTSDEVIISWVCSYTSHDIISWVISYTTSDEVIISWVSSYSTSHYIISCSSRTSHISFHDHQLNNVWWHHFLGHQLCKIWWHFMFINHIMSDGYMVRRLHNQCDDTILHGIGYTVLMSSFHVLM